MTESLRSEVGPTDISSAPARRKERESEGRKKGGRKEEERAGAESV
jgi:hypothetical protein